jgi:hypothetical protein
MTLVPCRSCRTPVFFAVTATGVRVPIDPQPTMTGSLLVTEHAGADPTCAPAPLTYAGPRFLSHLVTCAAQHQKSNHRKET